MNKKVSKLGIGTMTAVLTSIVAAAPAYAYVQPIWLEVNQSYYMPQNSRITRVAVTNPKIADVNVINKNAINIIALASGSTSLTVWTANGMRQEFMVSVSPKDTGLASLIQKAIDLPGVKVEKVGDKVLLRGTVANLREKEMAGKIAALYLGERTGSEGQATSSSSSVGSMSKTKTSNDDDRSLFENGDIKVDDEEWSNDKVINLLEMTNPDQINIETQVVEIRNEDAKHLGVEYGSDTTVSNPGTWYAGYTGRDVTREKVTSTSSDGTVKTSEVSEHYDTIRNKGSHWFSTNWLYTHFSQINAKIHALVSEGKARIISRPNITTMSGKTAGILIGGKIPYPKSNGSNGGTSVDYENYGIELDLVKPEVDKDGNVTSRLYASVSRLDWSNAVTVDGFNMPGIASRTAETMVNVPSGMTMAIGGLMNSDEADSVSGVPLLSKIPLLGQLFKYHYKTKDKTELLVLITPRVVNETTPVAMDSSMKKAYRDMRQEDQMRERVNLNEPVPPVEQTKPKQSAAKAKPEPPKAKKTVKAQKPAKVQQTAAKSSKAEKSTEGPVILTADDIQRM